MDVSELEQRAYDRIMLELTARTAMMFTHGALLVMIGLMMALTGAPAPIEDAWGPWSRLAIGLSAVVIGLTILFGAAETDIEPAGWGALVVGFATGMLWHVGLVVSYAMAAVDSRVMLLGPGEVLDASISSRGYIPLIYIGYVALTLIHLRTIWKLGPPPR